MPYPHEVLKQHLGRGYDPKADYLLETHRGAASRIAAGTHKAVGKVPDSSLNEDGTMIVLIALETQAEKAAKVAAQLAKTEALRAKAATLRAKEFEKLKAIKAKEREKLAEEAVAAAKAADAEADAEAAAKAKVEPVPTVVKKTVVRKTPTRMSTGGKKK